MTPTDLVPPGPRPAVTTAQARRTPPAGGVLGRWAAPRVPAGLVPRVAVLALVGITAIWGSTFFIIKDLVTRVPVQDFLAVRFAVATVALVALRPAAVLRLDRRAVRAGALLGLAYGVAQVLQTEGLARTPASVSGFVTAMYIVVTPLLGALVLRQRLGGRVWAAVGLAVVGLGVLALHGTALGLGVVVTLGSAVLYAVHIVAMGRWSRADQAYGLAVVQMAVVTLVCAAGAAPGGIAVPQRPGDWAALVYTALFAGALALVVQTWAQAHLDATRSALVMATEPVWAGAFAVVLGGETVGWRLLVGGALVLGATVLAESGGDGGE